MTWAVDQNYAMRRSELVAQSKPHVLQISARPVDQHNGRIGAGSTAGEAKLDHVQAYALNLDKYAAWRMCGLKLRNATKACRCEQAKHKRQYDDHWNDSGHHCCPRCQMHSKSLRC